MIFAGVRFTNFVFAVLLGGALEYYLRDALPIVATTDPVTTVSSLVINPCHTLYHNESLGRIACGFTSFFIAPIITRAPIDIISGRHTDLVARRLSEGRAILSMTHAGQHKSAQVRAPSYRITVSCFKFIR